MKTKLSNLFGRISRWMKQFHYILGIILILIMAAEAVVADNLIDSMLLVVEGVCILGFSIIEYKGFINKGIHWEEVYDKSQHKTIKRWICLFSILGFGAGVTYLKRNPVADVVMNQFTIPSSFWLNALLFLFGLIIVLMIMNLILTMICRCLEKINKRLDETLLEEILLEMEDDE